MTMSIDEFIEHHGTKGMRWGVRKSRSGVSKTGGGGAKGGGSSKKTGGRTAFQKSPSRLSDAELTRRVKRMETEKRYNDLNKKEVSEGKKFTGDLLKNVGKTVGTTLLAGAALYGISKALNAKMGPGVAEGITGKKTAGNKVGLGGTNLNIPFPPPKAGTRKG